MKSLVVDLSTISVTKFVAVPATVPAIPPTVKAKLNM